MNNKVTRTRLNTTIQVDLLKSLKLRAFELDVDMNDILELFLEELLGHKDLPVWLKNRKVGFVPAINLIKEDK